MFIFKKTRDTENQYDISDIEFAVADGDIEIDYLLTEFEHFLKACGYNFKGNVDIVESEEICE
jgi:hypothetical protein